MIIYVDNIRIVQACRLLGLKPTRHIKIGTVLAIAKLLDCSYVLNILHGYYISDTYRELGPRVSWLYTNARYELYMIAGLDVYKVATFGEVISARRLPRRSRIVSTFVELVSTGDRVRNILPTIIDYRHGSGTYER